MFSGYSKNFWLVNFSLLIFISSFNLILPEMNDFIAQLGGGHLKGLIIAVFTISAAISRPFSGKLSDVIGRKKVMFIGTSVCIAVSLLYSITASVAFFLILRFFHGFSAGFYPTGATALMTDILPAEKRAQGMGIFGTFSSLGIGVGQSAGSYIKIFFGYDVLFYSSFLLALIATLLIVYVKETLEKPVEFEWNQLKIDKTEIIEPHVFTPALIMLLTAPSSGLIFVITPEISNYLNIENKGWFFGFYVISTILIRLFTSKLSDIYGRRQVLIFGIVILLISLSLLAFSKDIFTYTFSAIVFGIGTGIISPTLYTYMADLSPADKRGVSAGTIYIALEIGIMIGSSITILLYNNTFASIFTSLLFGFILGLIAIVYLVWHILKRDSPT